MVAGQGGFFSYSVHLNGMKCQIIDAESGPVIHHVRARSRKKLWFIYNGKRRMEVLNTLRRLLQ